MRSFKPPTRLFGSDPRYDLIVINLPPPTTLQLNRFYTLEFFRMVRELMVESGVLVLKTPASLSYMNDELRTLNSSVSQTLSAVFPSVHPIPDETTFWMASPAGPLALIELEQLIDRWNQRAVDSRLITTPHIQLKLESEVDGNVVGRDDIVLGQEAQVGGDARAAGQVTLKQGATVAGDIVNNADLLSITQVSVGVSACGSGVTVAKGDTVSLAPGCYKELKVKNDATLELTACHYTFERIEANTDARLLFELPDGGQVVIDVADSVHLEQGVVMSTDDGSAADILFRVAGRSVKLGKDGTFLGTFIESLEDEVRGVPRSG